MGSTDEKTSIADQIAAEAWEAIIKRKLQYDLGNRAQFDEDCIAAIKSACEKAREPLLVEIKTAINENDMMPLFMALDECDEIKFSRAAHASEDEYEKGYAAGWEACDREAAAALQTIDEETAAHASEPTPATHVCDQGFGCPVCAATQDPQTKEGK